MTTFPDSPRLIKGALIGIDIFNPLASIIVFQYNPDTMTRRLEARTTGGQDGGDKTEALRLAGPPTETITLNVEFDAGDQPDVTPTVYPALSALEMLLYPKSAVVIANTALALLGNTEIIAPQAPLTIFVWGPQRVLPVRLTSFSITEQDYDPNLNPIRAKVDLSLSVLSYNDLKISNPGYFLFLAHQIAKETLATQNVSSGVPNLGIPLPFKLP
jgi:Contractile injection system tube protein